MQKNLHIYDFDGTLFKSPENTPANIKKFEKETGLPWLIDKEMSVKLTTKHKRVVPIRRGWWGRPETLEPPLVPNPAPKEWFIQETLDSLFESKKNPDVITLIMTGRHAGMQKQVLRILHDGNLLNISRTVAKNGEVFYKNLDETPLFCLGMDGPVSNYHNKPTETFPWKVWIIEQFCLVYPIENIQIWEDRDEHIEKFKALNLGPPINVIAVKSD